MTGWLSIVGIGEDGLDGLGTKAHALIENAEVLVGGCRHLDMIADDGRERIAWNGSLDAGIDDIKARRGERVCVLATGDPMHFGIGATLSRHVPAEEMTVVPAPSAFALLCARMGWPRADVRALSLHGRDLDLINAHIQPGARLAILGHDSATPALVAVRLVERGFGQSSIAVLEHMGGPKERRIDGSASGWNGFGSGAGFNTLAVQCAADAQAPLLPAVPGLPDDAFSHDGCITKREVRCATIAQLAPVPGQMLWDVGAGSGTVAVEWMRSDPACRAVAVERNPARAALARENAARLGVPGLEIVTGEAPRALEGLAVPDAVFIGGGVSAQGVIEAGWQALRSGGRLVAIAVTLEGERALLDRYAATGGTLTRIAVSRAAGVGNFTGWEPLRPVTQLAVRKP